MSTATTFQQYLQSAFISGHWSTDEVIEFVLPLFEEVKSFHELNQVGPFDIPETIFLTQGRLDIDESFTHLPSNNFPELKKLIDFQTINGYTITQRVLIDQDLSQHNSTVVNLEVQGTKNEPLTHPVFLQGYRCYEMAVGHHDAQTDIFCLGLILGSVIMGLDLYNLDDLNTFAAYRNQPAGLNPRVHPTLCSLVTEMTELNRADRTPDLQEIIHRLKFYRDYDPQKTVDLSKIAAIYKRPADKRTFVLSRLRNRLFDTSRRNRLLYYKPNTRFVNLTVSSVPMVLHFQSINPQLLFTWNAEISSLIIRQTDISLNKYLRFEDHPYLNSQLNSIRQQSENDKKEYGFSQLKLAVAFLNWHNLKEDISERIQSPLLLLPVELERKKSLKEERFNIKIIDNTATINPVVAHQLKELYGIQLPEAIDFDDTSMEQFFQLVEAQINAAKQGIKLNYTDKPRIKIVHSIARQTINNYRKRLKQKGTPAFHQVDYSYAEANYKPLGLELFRHRIEPRKSVIEFLLGEDLQPASANFAASKEMKSTFQITDGESNPYSWDFDVCNIVLGNFNYKRMSLVSDYNKITEDGIDHPVFNELFSSEPKAPMQKDIVVDPSEWYHVITADPTQTKAVLTSRSGKSYVIQGPPGTGKSQTITNLIADFLARGKTILFVCEKRAALDVVYHRLQQNKLSELCCYIHDSQGDKKEFIKDLRTVYEDFVKNKMDLPSISNERKAVLERLNTHLEILEQYHNQQKISSIEAGLPTRQLIEKVIQLKAHIANDDELKTITIPEYNLWLQFGQTVHELGKALEQSGAEPALAKHPFSNLGTPLIKAENPFLLIDNLVNHSRQSIQHLSEIIAKNNIPQQHASHLRNVKNLVEDSVVLESLAHSKNLRLVNASNPEAIEFEETYRQYKHAQKTYQQCLEKNKRWMQKLHKQDVEHALEIAKKHEKVFFSFLNSTWRRLKKKLKQSYDFSVHPVKPALSEILEQLREEYKEEDNLSNLKTGLQSRYNTDNVDLTHLGIEVLRRKQGDDEIDYLLQHPSCNDLVIQLSKLNNTLHQLELGLKQCLYGYEEKSLAQIKDEIATIYANADVLKDLLPALRRFTDLSEVMQSFIRTLPLTPVQVEAVIADHTLQQLFRQNLVFAGFNQKQLESCVSKIEDAYKELLKVNCEHIRAQRRQKFLKHYEISNTSATVLTGEQKMLKKEYSEGRRVLEHEMSKSMRYKSIRELASNESGKVLKDVKPVWLMSPLSVSDSLPLDAEFFDVVIFDEASQITLEEGIPALFRAPQSIIVGDDKQMPPSNFFSTKVEDSEDLEIIDGESEDEILSADADSLLIQGSRKLNSTMLSWHYRSRYETLISYSNHAFYNAGLLTVPDKSMHLTSEQILEIQQPEEGTKTANKLLSGSISFHYLPNSIYEARGNLGEAKYIAHMLKRLLKDNITESIGVVAFSQEQQGVIEEAITGLAETDKEFEDLLEKAFNRKDDGQFTGLFIKNLENVQGDERDIIIMSVCYGHDANKKMLMNFGPINRKGGEKRLNVIFSRAKKHMAVVSSIRYHHITNDYNDGASYFKRFLHYAEMVSVGNMAHARTILNSLIRNDEMVREKTKCQSIVANQIKEALASKGYVVNEQIGQSNFKCSLGIKKRVEDPQYSLGILIDDNIHYMNNNLVEQYVQRPLLLRAFGWTVVNVYGKDWLENHEIVLADIISKLEGYSISLTNEEKAPETGAEQKINKITSTLLYSYDGERFWEVAQKIEQLHIRFGRTGTKGQVTVKTYSSQEEASLSKEQIVNEQLSNGFKLH